MKRPNIPGPWLLFLCLMLGLTGCNPSRYPLSSKSNRPTTDTLKDAFTLKELEAKAGPLKPVYYPYPFMSASEWADSILKNGVDTLFIFSKYAGMKEGWPRFPESYPLMPVRWAKPAYLFWKKSGKYYTARIDEFGATPPRQCEAIYQYPVYDFWFRNEKEISAFVCPKSDSIQFISSISIERTGKRDTLYRKGRIIWSYLEEMHSPRSRVANLGYLRLIKPGGEIKQKWGENCFWPLSLADDDSVMAREWESLQTEDFKVKNSGKYYHLNQELVFYQFLLRVEAELFRLESSNLLYCQTYNIPPDQDKINRKTLRENEKFERDFARGKYVETEDGRLIKK